MVLPDPVGPVTRKMPCGFSSMCMKPARTELGICMWSMSRRTACLSSKRSTTRSPWAAGKVDTRTSTSWPARRRLIRPSWGTRFSAISRRAMTLMRETSRAESPRGGVSTSRMTPSMRMRTRSCCSKVSRWISEARDLTASLNKALSKRMIGASSCCSSRSQVCGKASANRDRSISWSRPWTTACAASWPGP
ncbi:hypothetical protein D3C80_1559420 [compost metagenome]